MKRLRTSMLALGTIAMMNATALPPTAAAQSIDCTPVVIMPIRGSDETSAGPVTYDGKSYEGWEGPTLRRFLKEFYTFPESRGVPIVEVGADYPAVAVDVWAEIRNGVISLDRSPVHKSAQKGAQAAIKALDATALRYRLAGCPIPKVVLVGYSQGMIAARSVAETLKSTGIIAGVYGVGDPLQKPDADSGVMGERSNGEGIFRFHYRGMQPTWDKFYSGGWENYTICHNEDFICGQPNFNKDTPGHFDYFASGRKIQVKHNAPAGRNSEANGLANLLVGLVSDLKESNAAPPVSFAKKDTVFLIDTTGSMTGVIDEARARARVLSTLVLGSHGGSRVSLVEYRDQGDEFVTRTVVPFTSDINAFYTGLDGLVTDGGGDWEEAVYSGVETALAQPYRSDAVRSVIVIGDAPAHDPDLVNGWTAAVTAERLRGFGTIDGSPFRGVSDPAHATQSRDQEPSIKQRVTPSTEGGTPFRPVVDPAEAPIRQRVSLYSLSTDPTLHAQMSEIAEATGGKAFSLEDSSGVGDAIEGALTEIDRQPVAAGGSEPAVFVGAPALLSCAGSSAPDGVASIGFDADGDLKSDVSCTGGVAEHTFTAAGDHEVTVIVSDINGRTSTTGFTVNVLPATAGEATDTSIPGAPSGSLGSLFGSLPDSGINAGSLSPLPRS